MRRLALAAPGRVAVVWLVLLAATLLSWESAHSAGEYRLASTAVLLIAFLKARLIGLEFMELRAAPRVLRFIFEAWVVAACGTLVRCTRYRRPRRSSGASIPADGRSLVPRRVA